MHGTLDIRPSVQRLYMPERKSESKSKTKYKRVERWVRGCVCVWGGGGGGAGGEERRYKHLKKIKRTIFIMTKHTMSNFGVQNKT